jgi:lysophospholipase L1-like esterase
MRGQRNPDYGWLTTALIRAGTLATGTAIMAAAFAVPAVAQPESAAPAPPAAPQASATQVQQREMRVVALGDSYFAGLGAGQYRAGAHRQSLAAGFLQALARLEAANPGLEISVQNNSSSGATIDNLYETQVEQGWLGDTPVNRPQLEGVDPGADVAIMGFGGNDIGFTGLIQDGVLNNGGATVRARLGELRAGQLNTGLPDANYLSDAARPHGQQRTVTGELIRAIQDAKAAMPHAQIVITTYPEVADPNATSMFSAIGPEELAAYRQIVQSLNEAIRGAARLTGATVAENSHAFAGHEVYTDDPYLHDLGPQWGLDNRDEAMHPNPAGQTALADAIADAVAKTAGLHPAAPYHGPAPYPTNRLTLDPVRPPRTRPQAGHPPTPRQSAPAPGRGEAAPKPDKINWTGGPLPIDRAPGARPTPKPVGPNRSTAPKPAGPKPDVPPTAKKPDEERKPTAPVQPPVTAPRPTHPENPASHNAPTRPGTGSSTSSPAPAKSAPGRSTPVDGSRPAKRGPADNPENGGDRGRPVKSGPADNPENGGDRGTRSQQKIGPADNPENGGDRGTRPTSPTPDRHESGRSGPADNPENGGDRGTDSSRAGQPSGRSGPADNPSNGGERDTGSQRSGKNGPADNPENGGDRGAGHSSSNPSGKVGPADNPENGGDRGTGNNDTPVG